MHLILLALFSALLLAFSFPNAGISSLAWFALVPYFFIIQEVKTTKQLLGYTFLTGFLYYISLMYWLFYMASWTLETWSTSAVVVFCTVLLSAILAAFYFFAAWTCWFFRKKIGLSFIWTFPVVWVAIEYIKNHLFTGYPWGLIGVSQYKFLPLIQISEWTGVFGVSFIVVMANALIFEVIYSVQGKRKSLSLLEVSVPIVLLVSVLFYGFSFFYIPKTYNPMKEVGIESTEAPLVVPKNKDEQEDGLSVSLIQGNIPQDVKWSNKHEDYIRDEYRRLSLEAIKKDKTELVIWPETAMPSYLRFDEPGLILLSELIKGSQIPFLVGASDQRQVVKKKGDKEWLKVDYYNTAFLLEPGKGFTQQYNKRHLVPFGEYMPWWITSLRSLSPLADDYSPGKGYTVIDFKYPFSVVICYEDIFPDLVRRFVNEGATWLVNMTNDGWFRDTSAPMQHCAHSIFRSVENRVWMVRCTNTGVSCFINPKGEIVSTVEDETGKNVWIPGTLTDKVYPLKEKTFYTKYGDVFSWSMFCIIGLFCWRLREKK